MQKDHRSPVLVLAQQGEYTARRIQQEGEKKGHLVNIVDLSSYALALGSRANIAAEMYSDANSIIFHRSTGVSFDDFDLEVAQYWQQRGALIYNSLAALRLCRDKILQLLTLHQAAVAFLPTFLYRGQWTELWWQQLLLAFTGFNTQEFVVKFTRGNGGLGVNLLRGRDSLLAFLDTFKALRDQRLFIQPFMRDCREYRVLILQQRPLLVLQRLPHPQDFRGNFRCQGTCHILQESEIPVGLCELALKATEALGTTYATVDLFYGDFPLVIEVNSVPGFKQMEEISGHNLVGLIYHECTQTYSF